MRKSYKIKLTDDRHYEKMRYTGETLEDAKSRIEKKRLAKIKKNNI